MINNKKIGVVIPCYMAGDISIKLVEEVLNYADQVIFVDDFCPLKTGYKLEKKILNKNLHVIFNKRNLGVGASTKIGFRELIKFDCDIIVKMDADFQMYPRDIPQMVNPIINAECESTKGNRFTDIEKLFSMPKIRLIGNGLLSYFTKLTTGYWELFDPTNGFIAFKTSVLKKLDLKKTDNRFFFETDLLFRCSLQNVLIKNIPIEPIYKNSLSTLNPIKQIPIFFIRHLIIIFKRIFYQYFLFDFNQGSLEIILSIIMFIISFLIGLISIYRSTTTGILTNAGTASIFTITTVVAFQLLISFIYYDCTTRVFLRMKKL